MSLLRRLLAALQLTLAALGILWLLLLAGRWFDWGVESTTVQALASPDGRLMATLIESRANAASPLFQEVRLAAGNGGTGWPVFRIESANRLSLRWTGRQALEIASPCGRFSEAANHFTDPARDAVASVGLVFPAECPGGNRGGAEGER